MVWWKTLAFFLPVPSAAEEEEVYLIYSFDQSLGLKPVWRYDRILVSYGKTVKFRETLILSPVVSLSSISLAYMPFKGAGGSLTESESWQKVSIHFILRRFHFICGERNIVFCDQGDICYRSRSR